MARVVRGLSVCLVAGVVAGSSLVVACKARTSAVSAVQEGQDGGASDELDSLLGKLETETRLLANDLALDTSAFDQSGSEGLALADDPVDPAAPPMTQEEIQSKIDVLQTEFNARVALYDGKDAQAGDRIRTIVADLERLKALLPKATADQAQQAEKVVDGVHATQTEQQQAQAAEQQRAAEERRKAAEQQAQQQAQQLAQEQAREQARLQAERESESYLARSYPVYTRQTKTGRGKSTFFVRWPVGAAKVSVRKDGQRHMSVNFQDAGWETFESLKADRLVFNGYDVNSTTSVVTSSGRGFTVEVSTDASTSWVVELDGPGVGVSGPIGTWSSGQPLVTNVRFFRRGETVTARGNMTASGSYYVKGSLIRVHPERDTLSFWSGANDRYLPIDARVTIPKSGYYLLHVKIDPSARVRPAGNVTLTSP
jgi:hypothetical protein